MYGCGTVHGSMGNLSVVTPQKKNVFLSSQLQTANSSLVRNGPRGHGPHLCRFLPSLMLCSRPGKSPSWAHATSLPPSLLLTDLLRRTSTVSLFFFIFPFDPVFCLFLPHSLLFCANLFPCSFKKKFLPPGLELKRYIFRE